MKDSAHVPYIGTKSLSAHPMTLGDYNSLRGWAMPGDQDPEQAGYLVEYAPEESQVANVPGYDGYVSWSPKEIFEASYQLTTAMNFGAAFHAAKSGQKIARAGWNNHGVMVAVNNEGWFMAMSAATDYTDHWSPDAIDLKSSDWFVVS